MAIVEDVSIEPAPADSEKCEQAGTTATDHDGAESAGEEGSESDSDFYDEEEAEEELDLDEMTASVIEIFKEGRQKEALQAATEFSTKAFQLYGRTHPTYINALATVAALVDRMGGEGEADQLLQQAEELQDEMEIEQAEQMLEEEFEEELERAVAAEDEEETSSGPENASSVDDDDDDFGYEDYYGEESLDGEEGEEELFGDDEPLNEEEQEEEEAEIITQLTWEVNSLIQVKQPEAAAKLLSECEKSLVETGPVSTVGQAALHTLWAAVLDEVGESDKAKELYHQALNCLEEQVGFAPQEGDADQFLRGDTEQTESDSKFPDQEVNEDAPEKVPSLTMMTEVTESPDLEQLNRQQFAGAAGVEITGHAPTHSPEKESQPYIGGYASAPSASVPVAATSEGSGYASTSGASIPVAAASEGSMPDMPISPSYPSKPRPTGKTRPGPKTKVISASDGASSNADVREAQVAAASDAARGDIDAEKAAAKQNATLNAESAAASESGKASGSKQESTVEEPPEKEKATKRTGGGFGVQHKVSQPPKKPKAKAKGGTGKATKEVKPQPEEPETEPVQQTELKPEEPAPQEESSAAPVVMVKTEKVVEEFTPEVEEAQIKKAMRNADHYIGMRKFEKAADHLEKHLVRLDQGFSSHRGSDLHLELLQQYGGVLRMDGDLDGSLDAFTAADELLEERPGSDLSSEIQISRSQLWMRMADVCREGDDLESAEGHLESAIAALEGLGEAATELLRQAQGLLARVYVEMKKYERAEKLYMKAFSEPGLADTSTRGLRGNESSDGESSEQEAPKVRKSTMKLKPGQSAGDMGLEKPTMPA